MKQLQKIRSTDSDQPTRVSGPTQAMRVSVSGRQAVAIVPPLVTRLAILFLCLATPLASAAPASFVETFEDGVNAGGWTFGLDDPNLGASSLQTTGGNPGWHSRASVCCDTGAPIVHTLGPSVFTGDYRSRRVVELTVDVQTFNGMSTQPPLNVKLGTDSGTPENPSDDYFAFFAGGEEQRVPLAGQSWRTLSFSINSQSEALPEGWFLTGANDTPFVIPEDATWSSLIMNVSSVAFAWDLPLGRGGNTLLSFDVGIDNPSITELPEAGSALLLLMVMLAVFQPKNIF